MNVHYITCPTKGCGYSPFPLDEGFEERARRTHETFYCPAGHDQYFPGESDLEKLRRLLRSAESNAEWWKGQADRNKRTCPWVLCDFQAASLSGLATHMRAKHGMPTYAEAFAEIEVDA